MENEVATFKEIMAVYNAKRAEYVAKFGNAVGFNKWFTTQVDKYIRGGDTVRTCTGRIGKVVLSSNGELMCEFHNGEDTYHTTLSQYADGEIELVAHS
jgi:hypothetical protein